ncbi:hypothetical protein EST38_g14411 [Candolleomyces aberdarensis]|uniref:Uncharacterized protein n=1 Tax=Candolleomyces aberdarensis TaxID=2316362 RepID=A0A4Q2CXF8_9AGAR|nr:hypothetical protein EST38_g14411 [Candolleomyces aberdarensis]
MSSIASDPVEPIVSDVTGPTLRPDCPADRTAGNPTLVQAVDNSDSELGKQHDVGASEQVFRNQDILPLIFLHSKKLGQLDRDRDSDHERANSQELAQPYSWKAFLASLIVVNKSFFHTGTNLLWDTMDSFTPVLKLLPWFSGEYKGIGSYEYLGSKDWDRFRVYSSRIHHFKIESTPDIVIPHDRLLQLLFLHQRPDPFFENLHSITFSSAASQALHILFIVVGPPLRSLEVSVATLEQQDKVLAILPVLQNKTTSLDTFRYSGPLCGEFILHVSNIKTLQFLTLKIATGSRLATSDVEFLRNLPNLQKLGLDFEPDFEFSDDETPLSWTTKRGKPETCGWQLELSGARLSLYYAPWLIAPTQLRCVTLQATGYANNYLATTLLLKFFAINRALESFSMHFGETGARLYSSDPVEAEMTSWATQALQKHKHIVAFVMSDLPHFVGEHVSPMLQASVPHWKRLKTLHFRLHESAHIEDGDATKCFPSLTFLFTICKECPNIEELNFQFNDDQITAPANLNWSKPPFPTVHPLRSLSIGTIDDSLELDMVQKAAIAAYIAGLFPRLESLTGFAEETWREIEVLVKVYQVVRDWGPIDPRTPSDKA